jgi:hypothetical protein
MKTLILLALLLTFYQPPKDGICKTPAVKKQEVTLQKNNYANELRQVFSESSSNPLRNRNYFQVFKFVGF